MTVSRPKPIARPASTSAPAVVTGRVDSDATPSRPGPHQLWLDAGGGTDDYDPDRFVGLLRDHGWAKERKRLSTIVFDILGPAAAEAGIPGFDDATCDDLAGPLARHLVDELGRHGYGIHDKARCVRPGGDPLAIGRPMSPEEEAVLLPRAGTPSGHFEHITPEGDRFLVPNGYTPGEKSSRCRSCGALILWCETRNKKRAPTSPDGTSHFASCPQAADWRKRQAEKAASA